MLLLLIESVIALSLPLQSAPISVQPDSNWTRFRGPNGSGVAQASDLVSSFDNPNDLCWRRELGNGYSSPVLFSQKIFLTTFEQERLFTLCLDSMTGLIIWKREAPRRQHETLDERNNPASPSPAVDQDVVIVFFGEVGLLAYDHNGQELWKYELGPFTNIYGMGASPILLKDSVLLACDQAQGSFLLCVDKRTGELRWQSERPQAKSGHCTPIVRQISNASSEILLPGSFFLDAYDPESGRKHWAATGLSFEMKSVPVLYRDLVLVAGYGSPMNQPGNQVQVDSFSTVLASNDADKNGSLSKVEMPPTRAASWFDFVDLNQDGLLDEADWNYLSRALASQNGLLAFRAPQNEAPQPGQKVQQEVQLVWSYRRAVPQLPSPLIYKDVLYLLADSGGLITTFRPDTGEELAKERIGEAVDTYFASPVAGDDKIYLASEHGLVVVLPAGGELDPLSVTDLGENIYATPALSAHRIYIRTTRALYCFEES